MRHREPYIIDVEASGFGNGSYPIEVGVVLNNGEKFCTLIVPAANWTHWDEEKCIISLEIFYRITANLSSKSPINSTNFYRVKPYTVTAG